MRALWHARVESLEQAFRSIADTRMQGVPVQNRMLRVQAIGFEPLADPAGEMLAGVLVTPWFMNLVRMPLAPDIAGATCLPVGQKARRRFGSERFEFIGADEQGLGAFEICSLFSPMFEFGDHASAMATAAEVLFRLRQPEKPASDRPAKVPGRRGFLLGPGADCRPAQA